MAKKIRKRRANYFDNGGFSWQKGAGFGKNMGNAFNSGALNSAIGAVGSIAGQGISGGLSSEAGNAMQGLGSIANAIPGPWGAIAGAGLNILGGLTNKLFGSTINEQAVANFENQNTQQGSMQFSANNTTDLVNQGNFGLLSAINKSDVGKDGVFSDKAQRITDRLNRERNMANAQAIGNYFAAAQNVDAKQDALALANYAAYGGPLTMRYTGTMSPFGNTFADGGKIFIKPENRGKFTALKERTGKSATWFKEHGTPAQKKMATFALNARKWKHAFGGNLITNGAEWDNGLTIIGNGGTHEENPMEGVQMGMDAQGIPNLVEEGEVIFNDYVFSNRMNVPNSMRSSLGLSKGKNLTFAKAAKKLSKESEERPNDPISKRGRDALLTALMNQQEDVRMKKQQREAKAQFNSLTPDEQLGIMQMAQQYAANAGSEDAYNNMRENPMMAAYGGKINNRYDFGSWLIKAFGKDAKLDNGFVNSLKQLYSRTYKDPKKPFGNYFNVDENSPINDVLESIGYIVPDNISDTISWDTMTPALWKKAYQRYFDEAEKFEIDNKNIPYSERWSEQYLKNWNPELAKKQFPEKQTKTRFYLKDKDAQGKPIATLLDNIPAIYEGYSRETGQTWDEALDYLGYTKVGNPQKSNEEGTEYTDYFLQRKTPTAATTSQEDTKTTTPLNSQQTYLRYAPVVGAAIGLGQNIFSKPDYSSSDAILNAANEAGRYTPVGFNPLGDYLTYRPFDRNYYINKLNAQSGATKRAIVNQSAGNRATALAGLLAADYNIQGNLGNLARQAEEYNLGQRERVATFNRGTNQFNSEMGLKAAMANQEASLKTRSQRLSGVAQAMQVRDAVDARRGASMSANLTNLFNSIGDIGKEAYSRNMIISNPALYYTIGSDGTISYKGGFSDLSESQQAQVRDAAEADKARRGSKAKGGYLTIKKK